VTSINHYPLTSFVSLAPTSSCVVSDPHMPALAPIQETFTVSESYAGHLGSTSEERETISEFNSEVIRMLVDFPISSCSEKRSPRSLISSTSLSIVDLFCALVLVV
jgi:hypothetical protein